MDVITRYVSGDNQIVAAKLPKLRQVVDSITRFRRKQGINMDNQQLGLDDEFKMTLSF